MSHNPFVVTNGRNMLLHHEICQRIHYTALQQANRIIPSDTLPEHIDSTYLSSHKRCFGADICLIHPADIERIFAGVTLGVYQVIENLYCTRLQRSMSMVWRILDAMASQAHVQPITYEAVWAICLHLQEWRDTQTAVDISVQAAHWQMEQLHSPTLFPLACVIDQQKRKVLAFYYRDVAIGINDEDAQKLALYKACIAQRCPTQRSADGLTWSLPMYITSSVALQSDVQRFCSQVGIRLEQRQVGSTFLNTLHDMYASWHNQVTSPQRFVETFDNYLSKIYGYGPIIDTIEREHQYAHLIGYNRDPAWLFPALRILLPSQTGVVAHDGSVACDGMHFEDDILSYWIGQSVTVRRSLHNDASAYISVDGEILCLAMARELRRSDGSYRMHLPGGGR